MFAVVGEDWKHYDLEVVDRPGKVDENTPPACRDDELTAHDDTCLADAMERHSVDFKSRLFDHLSTAPYSILTARLAGPLAGSLEKLKISMQDKGGILTHPGSGPV